MWTKTKCAKIVFQILKKYMFPKDICFQILKRLNLSARKEEQMQAELLLLCIHSDRQELQLQQRQRLHEDRKREVSDVLGILPEA